MEAINISSITRRAALLVQRRADFNTFRARYSALRPSPVRSATPPKPTADHFWQAYAQRSGRAPSRHPENGGRTSCSAQPVTSMNHSPSSYGQAPFPSANRDLVAQPLRPRRCVVYACDAMHPQLPLQSREPTAGRSFTQPSAPCTRPPTDGPRSVRLPALGYCGSIETAGRPARCPDSAACACDQRTRHVRRLNQDRCLYLAVPEPSPRGIGEPELGAVPTTFWTKRNP